ncbi:MAG: hypothetical protein ABS35_27640 [Kaistia sp. SCN 65-12]|nr:MAG: hypothetical protein ABS35_27640 [Kaistia sp. SCN 65-12]
MRAAHEDYWHVSEGRQLAQVTEDRRQRDIARVADMPERTIEVFWRTDVDDRGRMAGQQVLSEFLSLDPRWSP